MCFCILILLVSLLFKCFFLAFYPPPYSLFLNQIKIIVPVTVWINSDFLQCRNACPLSSAVIKRASRSHPCCNGCMKACWCVLGGLQWLFHFTSKRSGVKSTAALCRRSIYWQVVSPGVWLHIHLSRRPITIWWELEIPGVADTLSVSYRGNFGDRPSVSWGSFTLL